MSYVNALRYVQHEAVGTIVQLTLQDASGLYSIVDNDSADAELTVFNEHTTASEVRIVNEDLGLAPREGSQDGFAQYSASRSLFTMQPGAPKITLENLDISNVNRLPAIDVNGCTLVITRCSFQQNRARAIRIVQGDVEITQSTFVNNVHDAIPGGAIAAFGETRLTISTTNFVGNMAAEGGAVCAHGIAALHVGQSNFTNNTAIARGGAISIDGGAVATLTDQTVMVLNKAPVGKSFYLGTSIENIAGGAPQSTQPSRATYLLPAPRGHWVANAVNCTIFAHSVACQDASEADIAFALLPGGLDDDYPYQCASGHFGSSLNPRDQVGPQCSGPCPEGYRCSAASIEPEPCPAGTFCVQGSPQAAFCADGTYGTEERLTSQELCKTCEPGFYCRGGHRYACIKGTFSTTEGQARDDTCESCPAFSTTRGSGTSSRNECVCAVGYVDERTVSDTVSGALINTSDSQSSSFCRRCFIGTTCPSEGTTRETLPLLPGYYRPTAQSFDVQRCRDEEITTLAPNCSTSDVVGSCSVTASGCRGGNVFEEACRPGLTGTFCQLCSNTTSDFYYIAASNSEFARCEPCSSFKTGAVIGVIVAVIVGILISAWLAYRLWTHWLEEDQRRLMKRFWTTCTPHLKLKIALGVYLILIKVSYIYRMTLPEDIRFFFSEFELGISFGFEGLYTPLECVGVGGYLSRLEYAIVTPMAFVAMVVSMVALGAAFVVWYKKVSNSEEEYALKDKRFWVLVLKTSAPLILRMFFLAYPLVTTIAFQAYVCDVFDEGSWLSADVTIECDTSEHQRVQNIAAVAIVLYPVGLLFIVGTLLFLARRAILDKNPSGLSQAVSFLHEEYKVRGTHLLRPYLCVNAYFSSMLVPQPVYFYWELLEMLRRLLLVGLLYVIQTPGSLGQLAVATGASAAYLFVQMRASPYRNVSDDWIALFGTFCITAIFVLATYQRLLDLSELTDNLSPELARLYTLDALDGTTWVCVMGTMVVSALLLIVQIRVEQDRLQKERQIASARRLRYTENSQEVKAPALSAGIKFHLFLSHVWQTGQDQMRIVKDRLNDMMPDLRVFLDVDDLTSGRGMEGVIESQTVLIFASKGYFKSKNCMTELLTALHHGKSLVVLMEVKDQKSQSAHSALTVEDIYLELSEKESSGWGLAEEIAKETAHWQGFEIPTAKQIHEHLLFTNNTIVEWNRGEMSQKKPDVMPPAAPHDYHIYCSNANEGAKSLMEQLADFLGTAVSSTLNDPASIAVTQMMASKARGPIGRLRLGLMGDNMGQSKRNPLQVTSDPEMLLAKKCKYMLVYLDAKTYTSKDTKELCGEMMQALTKGVSILLAHEMVGLGQDKRNPVPFDSFFDTTPDELLENGIYDRIAIPLKGGEWRNASMGILATKILAPKSAKSSAGLDAFDEELLRRIQSPILFLKRKCDAGGTHSWRDSARSPRGIFCRRLKPAAPCAGPSSQGSVCTASAPSAESHGDAGPSASLGALGSSSSSSLTLAEPQQPQPAASERDDESPALSPRLSFSHNADELGSDEQSEQFVKSRALTKTIGTLSGQSLSELVMQLGVLENQGDQGEASSADVAGSSARGLTV